VWAGRQTFGSKILRKYPWIDSCRTLKWTPNNSTRIYLNLSGSEQGPGVGSCEQGNELSLSRNCGEFVRLAPWEGPY